MPGLNATGVATFSGFIHSGRCASVWFDVVDGEPDLREPGLGARLAEVGGERVEQPVLAFDQQIAKAFERRHAPGVGLGDTAVERAAGGGNPGCDVG